MPKPSPIEISFWENAKPLIPELEQEVWIEKYRVDFLIPSKKIIIELYGYTYHNTKQKITKDAERERYLQKRGYKIIRFTGTEIYKDVKKCVREVLEMAEIKPNQIEIKPNYETRTDKIKIQKKPSFTDVSAVYTPKLKDNYNRTPNKPRKINIKKIATIGTMSVIAVCFSCVAISTIVNIIGK